jgi:hypothetical protein
MRPNIQGGNYSIPAKVLSTTVASSFFAKTDTTETSANPLYGFSITPDWKFHFQKFSCPYFLAPN